MEYGINYGSDDCYLAIHMTDFTETAHQMYNMYLKNKYEPNYTNTTYKGSVIKNARRG